MRSKAGSGSRDQDPSGRSPHFRALVGGAVTVSFPCPALIPDDNATGRQRPPTSTVESPTIPTTRIHPHELFTLDG